MHTNNTFLFIGFIFTGLTNNYLTIWKIHFNHKYFFSLHLCILAHFQSIEFLISFAKRV